MFEPSDPRLTPQHAQDWGSERGLFRAGIHGDRSDDEVWAGEWRKNLDSLRLKDSAVFALDPAPGMRVLDIGSADGAQMVYCALMGAEVHGQDLDETSVAVANGKLQRLGLAPTAIVGDATTLLFDGDSFDGAISSDFHEHLEEKQQIAVLSEAWRVLKPGARLVLKTPNLAYLRLSTLFKRAREVAAGRDPRNVVIPHTPGTDDPQHIGLTTRWQLEQQLAEVGFDEVRFFYAPLRRFGMSRLASVLSTEVPVLRDHLCEDVFCVARKPIARSFFPT